MNQLRSLPAQNSLDSKFVSEGETRFCVIWICQVLYEVLCLPLILAARHLSKTCRPLLCTSPVAYLSYISYAPLCVCMGRNTPNAFLKTGR